MDDKLKIRINELTLKSLENNVTPDEFTELNDYVAKSKDAAKHYVSFIKSYNNLSDTGEIIESAQSFLNEAMNEMLWQNLVESENNAEALEEEPIESEIAPARVERTAPPRGLTYKVLLRTAAVLLIVLSIIWFDSNVRKQAANENLIKIAQLKSTSNAVWQRQSNFPIKGEWLWTGNYYLKQGYVELCFSNNETVVIEAPTKFSLRSPDSVFLHHGQVYATVPKEAIGFTINTENAKIVDLGTEFGVYSDINGNTDLHVLKGKTQLLARKAESSRNTEIVVAGKARRIRPETADIKEIKLNNNLFVREFDDSTGKVWKGDNINLANIVSGGDGFGKGIPDRGIDINSGHFVQVLNSKEMIEAGPDYVNVDSSRYIDGVFVPGVIEYNTPITSSGLFVEDIPKSDAKYWGYIFNGAWHDSNNVERHQLVMDGKEIGASEPAITMHSNLGITFDLSEIRKDLPGVNIKGFKTDVGVSETIMILLGADDFDFGEGPAAEQLKKTRKPSIDFWVYLDGIKAYHKQVYCFDALHDMEVEIDSTCKYMTIIVSEANDGWGLDWAVLKNPQLILSK